ncbi:MAG: MlaA family lipoprotein, partial [Candidatus Gastranaerophilales bacterium]|nr:MlaA family lipoprotein [Candidatus Gastranaerophilales bacterium]
MIKRNFILIGILICLNIPSGFCTSKYPDWGQEYLGYDRFENFNRKMFIFNGALNKYALRPVTIIWSSIMPKYGIERLKSAYDNILYPRRLVSSLIQRDFKAMGRSTARFLTNSTLGLGGMFDPAKRYLKLKPINEDMEQALAKLKMKKGPYLVVPVISGTTPRGLLGRALDAALDPTSYIGSPAIAAVKAGFTVNNAAIMQPLIKNLEQNFIDPYDITKKMYGLQVAILNANLDREEVLNETEEKLNPDFTKTENEENNLPENIILNENKSLKKIFLKKPAEKNNIYNVSDEINPPEPVLSADTIKGSAITDDILLKNELIPDIILENYKPQHPITDSMRTALFDDETVDNSMWSEMSIWNRSFKNRIKTDSVEITEGREKYKYRYIMQKDKEAPLAIIYPSVGEGINSHHSIIFAKLFYDEGYSVLIQGSAFHYDFVKSMPEDFRPGIPSNDVKYLRKTTSKIINSLEEKYKIKFKEKVLLGTSYGAMSALFTGDMEDKENSSGITKYISINPPVELLYALNTIDTNSENWDKNSDNLREKTQLTAAKILHAAEAKKEGEKIETLPFNVEESKLITGFVLHQKLTDLLFALENVPVSKKTDFYEKAKDINYADYAAKYLTCEKYPTLK